MSANTTIAQLKKDSIDTGTPMGTEMPQRETLQIPVDSAPIRAAEAREASVERGRAAPSTSRRTAAADPQNQPPR
jgi:hypothetical protein